MVQAAFNALLCLSFVSLLLLCFVDVSATNRGPLDRCRACRRRQQATSFMRLGEQCSNAIPGDNLVLLFVNRTTYYVIAVLA